MNRAPFQSGEWYHIYNRGVDKRKIFLCETDYERFLTLLHCANSPEPVHIGGTRTVTLETALSIEHTQPLIDIGAYCLMPNHIHLLVRELSGCGLSLFMQKLATGYTGYFNRKENRTGSLFSGTFKSKHVSDDRYLKRVANYIHANAAELVERKWKNGEIAHKAHTIAFLKSYRYSSLPDYQRGLIRPESRIINRSSLLACYEDIESLSIKRLLIDAVDFAKEEEVF